jgi:two-component system, chemotaxis family, sensor kinase CheA
VTRSRLAGAAAELRSQGADTRELGAALADTGRQLRDLRAAILRVRMVSLAEVLEPSRLLVRNLCRNRDRRVRLEIATAGAELDKAVAERLFPAVVHLLRNAVDHGIEDPAERERRGKGEGLVRVTAQAHSNRLLSVSIADDGRGIDRDAVARRTGREVSPDELLDALCEPGLSTRDRADATSGRGMGMDIVKRIVVAELGGELLMETTVGKGTTFVLRVPLTIAIVDAFMIECAGQRFAVPVSSVEEIVEVGSEQVFPTAGSGDDALFGGLLRRRGAAVPLVHLARVLSLAGGRSVHALVVRRGGEAIAFGLDRVVGQREAVVRPLEDPLVRVAGISGATDLGDGRATLVLDLVSLGARLGKERAA